MNIQLEKTYLIEKIKQVEDVDLIKALKSLLDFGIQKQSEYSIPEWHKAIVKKRLDKAQQNPETLLSWEDIMKELDS